MIKDKLKYFFNWKANPASVFYFAIPLAAIGFSICILQAYLQWTINGDIWYSIIVLSGLVILFLALWPIKKQLLQALREN